MLTSVFSDRFVDARQMLAPMVIMTVSRAILQIDAGQVLAVCTTDPDTKTEIPAWCAKTGARLLDTTERNGLLTFYIQRTA